VFDKRYAKVMGVVSVLLAALAGFMVGALWYGMLSKAWVADSGVPVDEAGKPAGGARPGIFAGAFLCILVVAGMMRHIFALSGIATPGSGFVAGLGVGLFLIAPWITMNVLYTLRPLRLAAIDGGYAALGCAVMGTVLVLI
jgi:hypothetical protein